MPFINFHNSRCHYLKSGHGPALLLVHGLGSCSDDWRAQITALAPSHTVLAVDLAGHGLSDKLNGQVDLAVFARQLLAVLNAENIDRAHIVGLSLGGAVALQLALDAPQRVASLVIANSRANFRPQDLRDQLQAWQRLWLIKLFGLGLLSRLIARRLFPHSAALRQHFVQRNRQNDKNVYLATLKALLRWDIHHRLGDIHCPTLILAAEHDYYPLPASRAMATALPQAQFAVIDNAHHAVSIERPQAFNRCLLDFLQTLPEQAPYVAL